MLSNKAFNKVLNMMADKPMTTERLLTVLEALDAGRDESIDAYFFGRLVGFDIKNKEALQTLMTKKVRRYIYSKDVLQSVEIKTVKIVSVGRIEIFCTYTYAHKDENSSPMHSSTSCTFLATDDEIDGIFDFVYKD